MKPENSGFIRIFGAHTEILALLTGGSYASFREEVSMSVLSGLKELLDNSRVQYEERLNPSSETNAELSHSTEMSKTIIVNADGLLRMAVLPVDYGLDLEHLRYITRSVNIRLATESELKDAFPTCEFGAIPPLGNLFGLPVFCDTRLEHNGSIEFNAETRANTIWMRFADFKRLANPTMIDLVDHHRHAA